MKAFWIIFSLVLMVVPAQAMEEAESSYFVSYDSGNRITTLHATGVGFEPRQRSLSQVQRRLLAKRAATVDGYRNLLRATRFFPRQSPYAPFRIETVSGFLKGAEVTSSRFYSRGRVEVDLQLKLEGQVESFSRVREVFIGQVIPVCEVKREKKYISKEDYENLFRQKK